MNFSGIARSSFVGKALRAPLALIPPSTVVPILQGPLRGIRWVVGSSTHGCWLGSYEYQKQSRFVAAVQPGDIIFDIGANVGFYTLLASVRAGHQGRIFAFEPLPRNQAFLNRHLELNRISNVEVMAAAVTDRCGQALFSEAPSASMGFISDSGSLEVQTVTIDDLVLGQGLPAPDVIKMDIEGGEVRALLGARRVLANHHPVIFLATHGSDIHRFCCSFLMELGYGLKAIDGMPLNESDELLATMEGAERAAGGEGARG